MGDSSEVEKRPSGQRHGSTASTNTPHVCRAVVDMWGQGRGDRKASNAESDEEAWSCPSDSEAAPPMTDTERKTGAQDLKRMTTSDLSGTRGTGGLKRMATADLWKSLETTLRRDPEEEADLDEEAWNFSFADSFRGFRSVLNRVQENISQLAGGVAEDDDEGLSSPSVPSTLEHHDILHKAISRAPSRLDAVAKAPAARRASSPKAILQRLQEQHNAAASGPRSHPSRHVTEGGTGTDLPSFLAQHEGLGGVGHSKAFTGSSGLDSYGLESSLQLMADTGSVDCGSASRASGLRKVSFEEEPGSGEARGEGGQTFGGVAGSDGMLVMSMSSTVLERPVESPEYDQDFMSAMVSRSGKRGSFQRTQTAREVEDKLQTFHSIVDGLPESCRRRVLEQFVRQEKQISHLESVIRFYEDMLQGGTDSKAVDEANAA